MTNVTKKKRISVMVLLYIPVVVEFVPPIVGDLPLWVILHLPEIAVSSSNERRNAINQPYGYSTCMLIHSEFSFPLHMTHPSHA
jgi:hypothetical protein